MIHAFDTIPQDAQKEAQDILVRYRAAQQLSLLFIPLLMGLLLWGCYYFISQPGWTFDAGSVACGLLLVQLGVLLWMCVIRLRQAMQLYFDAIPQDLQRMRFYTRQGTVRKYLSNSLSTGSQWSLFSHGDPFCYVDFGDGVGTPIIHFDFSLLPNRQELCEMVGMDDVVEITYAAHSELMIGMRVVKSAS